MTRALLSVIGTQLGIRFVIPISKSRQGGNDRKKKKKKRKYNKRLVHHFATFLKMLMCV